jgi:DNA-binding transcriptional LysR family regulator
MEGACTLTSGKFIFGLFSIFWSEVCNFSVLTHNRGYTIGLCESHGFQPQIVQETPQWPTAIRLIAAGLGVSIAPACVAKLAIPGVVFRRIVLDHIRHLPIGWISDALHGEHSHEYRSIVSCVNSAAA